MRDEPICMVGSAYRGHVLPKCYPYAMQVGRNVRHIGVVSALKPYKSGNMAHEGLRFEHVSAWASAGLGFAHVNGRSMHEIHAARRCLVPHPPPIADRSRYVAFLGT